MRTWWPMFALIVVGCFDAKVTQGLPCTADDQCGGGQACENGFCGGDGGGITSVADTTGTSSTGSGESGSTTAVTEVSVSGTVQDILGIPPQLPGVTVHLLADPQVSTVTDENGAFTLDGLTPETTIHLVADESTDYWGSILPLQLGTADVTGLLLPQVSEAFVLGQVMLLQDDNPMEVISLDDTRGSILAQSNILGTEFNLNPLQVPNTYYAPDAMITPVLNLNVTSWETLKVVVFFNIEPGIQGSVEVQANQTIGTEECVVALPFPPIAGRTISLVEAQCN